MKSVRGIALAMTLCAVGGMVSTNAETNPVVSVTGGQIEGRVLPVGGAVFKGVPFARPPVGDYRWREPAPVLPWQGVRDAGAYGPACVQQVRGNANSGAYKEDCLYLNVWTPEWPVTSPKPVMVWLYGGGNVMGSGSSPQFDGVSLTRKGVILVTINYRMGLFGFFAHPGLTAESPHHASGNYGVMDGLAALKWVAANISNFGGDPKRVTLFGQSSGSINTGLLLISPLTKGLVSGIIQESGPPVARPYNTLAEYEDFGVKIATELKAPAGAVEALKFLRSLPPEEILKEQQAVLSHYHVPSVGPINPNVDGYVVPETPARIFKAGKELNVPLLIGNTAQEHLVVWSPEELKTSISTLGPDAAKMEAVYGLTNGGKGIIDPLYGAADIAYSSDRWYRCGAVAESLWHSENKRVTYEYQYDYATPGQAAVVHGAEVRYVFGNLQAGPGGAGGAAPPTFGEVDHNLSDTLQQYWTNFAKTGDPNGPGLEKWPKFDPTKRGYLEFKTDGQPAAKESLRRDICDVYIRNFK